MNGNKSALARFVGGVRRGIGVVTNNSTGSSRGRNIMKQSSSSNSSSCSCGSNRSSNYGSQQSTTAS